MEIGVELIETFDYIKYSRSISSEIQNILHKTSLPNDVVMALSNDIDGLLAIYLTKIDEHIDDLKDTISNNEDKIYDLERDIDKLTNEVEDKVYDYDLLSEDMDQAMIDINDLQDLVELAKDENEVLKDTIEKLKNDIISM